MQALLPTSSHDYELSASAVLTARGHVFQLHVFVALFHASITVSRCTVVCACSSFSLFKPEVAACGASASWDC